MGKVTPEFISVPRDLICRGLLHSRAGAASVFVDGLRREVEVFRGARMAKGEWIMGDRRRDVPGIGANYLGKYSKFFSG
jgi:hypothetical protein